MPKAKAGRSLRTFKSCGRPVAATTYMPHAGCAGLCSLLGCARGPDLHPTPGPDLQACCCSLCRPAPLPQDERPSGHAHGAGRHLSSGHSASLKSLHLTDHCP